MKLSETKRELPLLLFRLHLKAASLFFQKLFLFDQSEEGDVSIRHYDLECEGISIISDFFKTRKQNTLLKAFLKISEHRKVEKAEIINKKTN